MGVRNRASIDVAFDFMRPDDHSQRKGAQAAMRFQEWAVGAKITDSAVVRDCTVVALESLTQGDLAIALMLAEREGGEIIAISL